MRDHYLERLRMGLRTEGAKPKYDRYDMPVTCEICGMRLRDDEARVCDDCVDNEESFGESDRKLKLEDEATKLLKEAR